MKKLLTLGLMLLATTPVFAANLEMLDEITYGAKIQSQDIILRSDYIDIGAEIGAFDFHNSDSIKNSAYAMGTITIKKFSIFDLTKKDQD